MANDADETPPPLTLTPEMFGATEEPYTDRVTVYIPSQDRDGKAVDNQLWKDRFRHLLSDIGGGATELPPCQGAWLNKETSNLIVEDITIIYSYVDPERFILKIDKIKQFLHKMGRDLNK